MMMLSAAPNVVRPMTIEDAVRVLHDLGDEGAPLAGGTWVMRTQHRGATFVGTYVSVHGLASLRGIDLGVLPRIGALVTHAELAEATLPPALIGLGIAAATSAFPAVRSVATLGGNLAASPFPEADLVPALIAADARILLADIGGRGSTSVASYLADRDSLTRHALILGTEVPAPAGRRSGFRRLTIRGSGEYAVASVAVSVDLDDAGQVIWARVATGSVEEVARLSEPAAAALVGRRIDRAAIDDAGSALAADRSPRDGLDAPAWYRTAVLPRLLRDAMTDIVPGGPS